MRGVCDACSGPCESRLTVGIRCNKKRNRGERLVEWMLDERCSKITECRRKSRIIHEQGLKAWWRVYVYRSYSIER